jgi:hypothetical protein
MGGRKHDLEVPLQRAAEPTRRTWRARGWRDEAENSSYGAVRQNAKYCGYFNSKIGAVNAAVLQLHHELPQVFAQALSVFQTYVYRSIDALGVFVPVTALVPTGIGTVPVMQPAVGPPSDAPATESVTSTLSCHVFTRRSRHRDVVVIGGTPPEASPLAVRPPGSREDCRGPRPHR